MFLDESGDHSLTAIDPQYPVFVLGGIIVDHDYAAGELEQHVREFKRSLFGRDDFILHTSDIVRSRGVFSEMRHTPFRMRFYDALNDLMRLIDYQVIACVIKKDEHYERFGLAAIDPYMLSLNVLVERFCFEIGDRHDAGFIVAEKRDPTLDHQLELAWLNLRIQGTRYMQATVIRERITTLNTRSKHENIAGLQIADLIVSPIGRYVLGKNTFEDWDIIESKFRRRDGEYQGAGLVVLPRGK
ncbi:DUF3800 domain-containing protein [soil metagenome]